MWQLKSSNSNNPDATTLARLRDPATRVAQVITWMTTGLNESAILDQLRTLIPDTDPTELLQQAVTHLVAVGTIGQPGLRATYGWAMEATKSLFEKAIKDDDTALALKAVMQIRTLATEAAALVDVDPDDDIAENESTPARDLITKDPHVRDQSQVSGNRDDKEQRPSVRTEETSGSDAATADQRQRTRNRRPARSPRTAEET